MTCPVCAPGACHHEDVTDCDVRSAGGSDRHAREYRKTATVWAVQAEIPFKVSTLEGVMVGDAGDYLCQGPAGEKWPVKRAIFEATYEEVPAAPSVRCPACSRPSAWRQATPTRRTSLCLRCAP